MISEENRATATGNMNRKIGEVSTCGFSDIFKQADRLTDMLVTKLCFQGTGND